MSPDHRVVKSYPDVLPHRSFIVSYDLTFLDVDEYLESELILKAIREVVVNELHSPNKFTRIL